MKFQGLLRLKLLLIFICNVSFLFITNINIEAADKIYTVESVPNPKSSPGWEYVSNPDGVLSSSTVTEINSLLKGLEDSTASQIAVVVVNSIGETLPKDFAIKLFNYWGIGDKEKDNGLLILMVMDQRSIEFETGKGMEGILPDVTCKHIQEQFMIPYAKAGNYDAAVLGGVKAVIMQIEEPENVQELYTDHSSAYDASSVSWWNRPVSSGLLVILGLLYLLLVILGRPRFKRENKPTYILKYRTASYWVIKTLLMNLALPAAWIWIQFTFDPPITSGELLIAVYIFLALLLLERRIRFNTSIEKYYGSDRHAKHLAFSKSHNDWILTPIFFPIPFLFYSWWKNRELNKLRNASYNCEKCGNLMTKLDEKSDDQYLTKGQLTEEEIHSVDYDVWHCNNCGNQQVLSYVNLNSKYIECNNCRVKASFLKERKTILAPTYTHEGKGEKIFDCMNCHTITSETYVISKLQESTSSSYSGSGSSFSGSGGGGGSSWGGGSSGGGAGSKW